MLDSRHGAAHPPTFTYTLRQLAAREEIVFKSVVRVLQGKTRHAWQHTEAADADLVVIGTQACDQRVELLHVAAHAVVRVSATAGPDFRGLTLPLRIADVISYLDGAGDEIAGHTARSASPDAGHAHVYPPPHALVNQRVCLTRWPGPALLRGDVRYLKLAAVLTGLPLNSSELAARTQFPLQLCQTFVDALNAAGLVRVTDAPREAQAQKTPAAGHHGFIARIRSRLEMFVGASAAK